MGNIKYLDLGDEIRIGPTPVNKLIVDGIVVGRDDMDNILLLDTTAIRSIPKKTVLEVASTDLIQLDPTDSIRDASKILSDRDIEGAPVVEDGHVIGILTLSDIIRAIGMGDEEQNVSEVMSSKNIITVKQDLMIADAIEIMNKNSIGRVIVVDDHASPIGIVTRTDLLDKIAGLR